PGIDRRLRLEDSDVRLARLRQDRPAGIVLAVDGRGDGEVDLRVVGGRVSPGDGLRAFTLAGLERELREHEVAVLRRAGTLCGERRVRQDLQADRGDPLQIVREVQDVRLLVRDGTAGANGTVRLPGQGRTVGRLEFLHGERGPLGGRADRLLPVGLRGG